MYIHITSWLPDYGKLVTHLLWVQEVPGSIPGSGKGFYVCFLYCCCCVFTLRILFYTLFVKKNCNSFFNVFLFSILNESTYSELDSSGSVKKLTQGGSFKRQSGKAETKQYHFKDARSVSLYPYSHKSCKMLSILNKLTLQKDFQNDVTNNVFMEKN